MLETYASEQPMAAVDGTHIGELKYIIKKSDYIYSNTNRLINLSERMLDAQGNELVQKLTNYTYDSNGNQTSQIAEELGYKDVHNLYVFMRRRGYVWNSNKGLYVVKGEKQEEELQEVIEDIPTAKVGTIIFMFIKKMNGKENVNIPRFSLYGLLVIKSVNITNTQ